MSQADAAEIAKFDAMAGRWWDLRGPMRVLHAMNPARVGWIAARLADAGLAGTALLDVGCGAGIAAEALAAKGYDVVGIDAAPAAVAAARAHAPAGVALAYRDGTAEALLGEQTRFGAITALEVIEHVADQGAFVATLARLLRPGGMLVMSTLDRSAASYATAKIGAEYVARLLPAGTHDWARFVTPAELAFHCRAAGLRVTALAGLRPGLAGWRAVPAPAVNYMIAAVAGG